MAKLRSLLLRSYSVATPWCNKQTSPIGSPRNDPDGLRFHASMLQNPKSTQRIEKRTWQ